MYVVQISKRHKTKYETKKSHVHIYSKYKESGKSDIFYERNTVGKKKKIKRERKGKER